MYYATENSINFLQCLVISSVHAHQSINRQRIKFSLCGPYNANLSMTSSASTEVVSAWMLNNAEDVRRFSLMAERRSLQRGEGPLSCGSGHGQGHEYLEQDGDVRIHSYAWHAVKVSLADFGRSSDTTVHRCRCRCIWNRRRHCRVVADSSNCFFGICFWLISCWALAPRCDAQLWALSFHITVYWKT